MSDLGQLLRKARTERDITLDQLQESTKIRKRYLEAIEEGDFKVLPGNFYVRAFIKSYSEAVGLDPDEVLRLYRNVIPSTTLEPDIEPIRRKRTKPANTERLTKWASAFLMICFPLLIITLIYVYLNYYVEKTPESLENIPITEQRENDGQTPADNENTPIVTAPAEPEPTGSEPEPEPNVTFVNIDGTTSIYTATDAESLRVEFSAPDGRCWVLVREGSTTGRTIAEKNYEKGETAVWEVDDSIHIRMGYARAVEISVNGVLLDRIEKDTWNVQINLVNPAT